MRSRIETTRVRISAVFLRRYSSAVPDSMPAVPSAGELADDVGEDAVDVFLGQRVAVEADGGLVQLQRLFVDVVALAGLGDGVGDVGRALALEVRHAELAVGDAAGRIVVDGMELQLRADLAQQRFGALDAQHVLELGLAADLDQGEAGGLAGLARELDGVGRLLGEIDRLEQAGDPVALAYRAVLRGADLRRARSRGRSARPICRRRDRCRPRPSVAIPVRRRSSAAPSCSPRRRWPGPRPRSEAVSSTES